MNYKILILLIKLFKGTGEQREHRLIEKLSMFFYLSGSTLSLVPWFPDHKILILLIFFFDFQTLDGSLMNKSVPFNCTRYFYERNH